MIKAVIQLLLLGLSVSATAQVETVHSISSSPYHEECATIVHEELSKLEQLISGLVATQTAQETLLQTLVASIEEKLVRQENSTNDLQRSLTDLSSFCHNDHVAGEGRSSFYRCTTVEEHEDFVSLHAGDGRWPQDGFCRMLSVPKTVNGVEAGFTLSVQLYSHHPHFVGHPGVLFNARDENNFDVVYFRPHSAAGCFQAGYVSSGTFHGTATGSCPGGPPPFQLWFRVELVVRPGEVLVKKDGLLVTTLTPHFTLGPGTLKVGVLTCRGYDNVIRYKNLRVSV